MAEKTPEEIALERIKEIIETGSTEISLSRLGLTKLPDELWQLTNLTSLGLSGNELTTLPPEIGKCFTNGNWTTY
jgi:Leucine-rich repeat (LRR) protein